MLKRLILALKRLFEPQFTLDILFTPRGKPPTRSYEDAAAYDLYAAEQTSIPAHGLAEVRLGICTEFTPGYVGLMWDRSGMASKGFTRFGGVIDSDYRGEWKALIYNTGDTERRIALGDKVIQVIFQRFEFDRRYAKGYRAVDELTKTERGAKGFNSTGNK